MNMQRVSQDLTPATPPFATIAPEIRVTELYASFVLACACGGETFAVMSADAAQTLSCPCGREWDIRIVAEAEPRPLL